MAIKNTIRADQVKAGQAIFINSRAAYVVSVEQLGAQENIEYMIAFYLDWFNNWITPAAMADHYGVTIGECTALINAGRALFDARAAE